MQYKSLDLEMLFLVGVLTTGITFNIILAQQCDQIKGNQIHFLIRYIMSSFNK